MHRQGARALERLIGPHQVKSVIYLGDDISDTDALGVIHRMRDRRQIIGLSVGVLHADTLQPIRAAHIPHGLLLVLEISRSAGGRFPVS
jgi:hypothetical protein